MTNDEKIIAYQKPIRMFKALTVKQLIAYMTLLSGETQTSAASTFNYMKSKGQFNSTGNVVLRSPKDTFDRKTSAAFWGYLCFINKTEDKFFPTDYPSPIGFADDDRICKITVCDDKYSDKEMIALRERTKEDVYNVIVGINIPLNELHENIRPQAPFTYIEMQIENILTDIPKMVVTEVKESGSAD